MFLRIHSNEGKGKGDCLVMTVRESSEAVHTVEFRNISKYFPGVKALDNVSFSATSHFVYAIVG